MTPAEGAALRELDLPGYEALDRLRGRETDGAFLVRRVAAMPGDTFTREAFFDAIDASFELLPGKDTPARTHAKLAFAPVAFGDAPIRRGRPSLRAELRRPPRAVKRLSTQAGRKVVELGRAQMATRQRDIDGFAYGDPRDAWLVDDGDGLAFTLNGVVPERRAVVPATYGALTLRNGVPIGYLQADLAARSAALSYHAFATFRGGEAAYATARMLTMLHHVLGARSFTLDPYQLGKGNDDGIGSGAWWFYYKLGFRPRAASVKRVMRVELERLRANPRHRSSPATLRRLAEGHLVFDVDPRRPVPLPPTARIGLRVADSLAARSNREDASREAMRRIGGRSFAGWTPGERLAWQRWSPLILTLPGVSRWGAGNRRALLTIVRAKGGVSETEFLARLNAHPLLRRMLLGAALRRRAWSRVRDYGYCRAWMVFAAGGWKRMTLDTSEVSKRRKRIQVLGDKDAALSARLAERKLISPWPTSVSAPEPCRLRHAEGAASRACAAVKTLRSALRSTAVACAAVIKERRRCSRATLELGTQLQIWLPQAYLAT